MAFTKILLFIITLLICLSESKVSHCTEAMSKHGRDFFYCTKFSVGKGQAFKSLIRARFTRDLSSAAKPDERGEVPRNVQLTVAVYEHKYWQQLLAMQDPSCQQKRELAFRQLLHRIPLDGSEAMESYVTQTERNWHRPVMYYMAVMDCDESIHDVVGANRFSRIRIEAVMTANDDHFAYEKQGIIWTDTLLLVTYCALFFFVCRNMYSFEDTFGTKNTPHIYCLIAMGLQAFAICCDLAHWTHYASNGEGLVVLDVFGTIFDLLSECMMTLVVLMLANGWYTRFKTYDVDDGMETYAPLFLIVIMMHVLFGALGYVDQDAQHKYHDFQGWVGAILICTKLTLVAAFFYFYSYSVDKIQKESKAFYHQVTMLGLFYLLSDPLAILTSYFLAEYNREFYFRISDQGMHIFLQAYILFQMQSRNSSFTKSVHAFTSLTSVDNAARGAEKQK